jgi:hypothetical protein
MRPLRLRAFIILAASSLFIGCSLPASTPQPGTPANVPAEVLPTQTAAELLRISGAGAPYTSAPLEFSSDVTLLVHWEQTSVDEFSFVMVNEHTPPGTSPAGEVMFELAVGPSSGSGEAGFTPGSYVVKVTAADGPWLIWIETVELPPDVN